MLHALRYTEDLEKAGFSADQAKAAVKVWMEFMSDNFATKYDLREMQFATKSDFKDLKLEFGKRCDELEQKFDKRCDELVRRCDELDKKIEDLKAEMNYRFQQLEYKLTIKLGGLMALGIGLMAYIK